MKPHLLVTLADKNYIDPAKQLFSSAYFNGGWDGDYMLLSCDIPDEDLKWFSEKGIIVKKCKGIFKDEEFENLYEKSVKNMPAEFIKIVSNKFILFSLEFKQWRNVIYFDNDIIAKASLESLSNVNGFWAVRDGIKNLSAQFLRSGSALLDELKEKYDMDAKTFNSGVMAFSTDIIQDGMCRHLVNLLKKYNAIRLYADQPFLNLLFYKNWGQLNVAYNTTMPFFNLKTLPESAVLHFAGPKESKPWRYDNPYYKEWKSSLDKAEFIDIAKPQKAKKITACQMRLNSIKFKKAYIKKAFLAYYNFLKKRFKALQRNFPFF